MNIKVHIRGDTLNIEGVNELSAADANVLRAQVQGALAERGLSAQELTTCELALAEACNNAINYAAGAAQVMPIEIEVMCSATQVEFRVNDHTSGFEWPSRAELPDSDSERGRGLYLIQSLMDNSEYFRGTSENSLRMRMNRLPAGGPATAGANPEEV